jgi:low affinity Fe/Cu permease
MANHDNSTEKGFHIFATQAASWVGTKWAFLIALLTILIWLVSGPYFSLLGHLAADYQYRNDRHNVSCCLPHSNTQNRDAKAIHLKLDEIIKSIDKAHNEMIDIEHLSDSELQRLADRYQKVREECDVRSRRNKADSDRN